MARQHGMDQCPKCSTWRTRGWELVTHIHVCTSFRCPFCGHPRTTHGEHYCTAAQYEAVQAAKKASAQLSLRAAHVTPPAPIVEAFQQWLDRTAYIDGNGNYHTKRHGERNAIAPWNKTVKRAYATCDAFHTAAHAWAQMQQGV